MRSRDSASRLPIERVLRGAAFAALAFALWRALAAVTGDAPPRLHASLANGLTSAARDSLAALSRAGVTVSWDGALAPVAAMAEPIREPDAGWRVSVVAESGAVLHDALGAIDSLGIGSGAGSAGGAGGAAGGSVRVAGVRGALGVREGGTTALLATPMAAELRRVLVFGRAGWESKFTIAALEEAGWEVDARLRLSDTLFTTQGRSTSADRARHAAVVVLDTAVGRFSPSIARFVRGGGGLVMAGEGAGAPSLRALAPARVARVVAPESRSFEGIEPLHALPLHLLASLRPDAATLAMHDGAPAIVARRVGSGRVVQAGYAETWRWRMQAEGRSVEEHRAFWSRLVGAAARVERGEDATDDDAMVAADSTEAQEPVHTMPSPLAEVVQALGPPTSASLGAGAPAASIPWWIGPLALLLLVGEWASRRARGAP